MAQPSVGFLCTVLYLMVGLGYMVLGAHRRTTWQFLFSLLHNFFGCSSVGDPTAVYICEFVNVR